jgi:hypothetical protein
LPLAAAAPGDFDGDDFFGLVGEDLNRADRGGVPAAPSKFATKPSTGQPITYGLAGLTPLLGESIEQR